MSTESIYNIDPVSQYWEVLEGRIKYSGTKSLATMGQINYNFNGETVVITGASSGIGREVAIHFADAGATVVNGDLVAEPDHVDVATHELIENRGGTSTYVETDVTEQADLVSLIEAAHQYGGVDVMVNNAGVNFRKSVLNITPEEFESGQRVNLAGPLFGTQIAAKDMIDRDSAGKIINTASIRTDVALSGQVMYNATKGGVKMLTKSAALDLADYGIRVNAVAPGRTVTALADTTQNADEMADSGELEKQIPMERPARTEQIAPTFLYVASEAADYMTGEVVTIDGGLSVY